MRVFYLLAIVFVVDGHTTNGHLFEMNGLFRYYSFHLMMFAFGSGYFFKLYGGACSDLAHRAKKLLVPLYLWNAVYGVGAALLRRFGGFELGAPLSPYTCCSRRSQTASTSSGTSARGSSFRSSARRSPTR